MKSLYEVRTKQYKSYYVMASGYDEAKLKAEEHLIYEDNGSVLEHDGSLRNNYFVDQICEIKLLAEKVII